MEAGYRTSGAGAAVTDGALSVMLLVKKYSLKASSDANMFHIPRMWNRLRCLNDSGLG